MNEKAQKLRKFLTEEVLKVLFILYNEKELYTRELAQKTKLSLRRVSSILRLLESKGLIEREERIPYFPSYRFIYNKLTDKGRKLVELLNEVYELI